MNICIAALFLTHSPTANPLSPTEWSHWDQIKQSIFGTVAQHSHFPNHAFYFTFVYSKDLICIKRTSILYRRSKDAVICYFNDKASPKLKFTENSNNVDHNKQTQTQHKTNQYKSSSKSHLCFLVFFKFPSMATLPNRHPGFVCQRHKNVLYPSKCTQMCGTAQRQNVCSYRMDNRGFVDRAIF